MGNSVESTLGAGTTFTIKLPLTVSDKQQTDEKQKKDNVEQLKESLDGLSILLAEDNEFNQMLLRIR